MEYLLVGLTVAILILLSLLRRAQRGLQGRTGTSARGPRASTLARPYAGDFTGKVNVAYSPSADGKPDPGEVVWTWVPFEEDHSRGKDRPVLLVGRDGPWLLGLQLSSHRHSASAARRGQAWLNIGSGQWDPKRRPSSVRLDRVVRVDPAAVRREGSILDSKRFTKVAHSLKRL